MINDGYMVYNGYVIYEWYTMYDSCKFTMFLHKHAIMVVNDYILFCSSGFHYGYMLHAVYW